MTSFYPVNFQCGTSSTAVVSINYQKMIPSSQVNLVAINAFKDYPSVPVDGVGATLVFQSESGIYVLGGIRPNNDVSREKTKLNIDFPEQIITAIGGKLMDPSKTLREATLDAIAYKMFHNRSAAQGPAKRLFDIIENDNGWDDRVSIQTTIAEWGKMCYVTSVKRIPCKDSDLQEFSATLSAIMAQKKQEGAEPRNISNFRFQVLFPIVISAVESHFKTDTEKALHAHIKYPNTIAVTFNDVSVTALAKAGVFDGVGAHFIQFAFIVSEAVKQAFEVANTAKKAVQVV